jgi:hypothetical protein
MLREKRLLSVETNDSSARDSVDAFMLLPESKCDFPERDTLLPNKDACDMMTGKGSTKTNQTDKWSKEHAYAQ